MTTNTIDFIEFNKKNARDYLTPMEAFIRQQHSEYVLGITNPTALTEYYSALNEELGEEHFTLFDRETMLVFFSEINRALFPLVVTQNGNNFIDDNSKVIFDFDYIIDRAQSMELSVGVHFFNKDDEKVFCAQFLVEQSNEEVNPNLGNLPLLTFPKEKIQMLSVGEDVPSVAPLNMLLNEFALDTYAGAKGGKVTTTTVQTLLDEEQLLSMGKDTDNRISVIRDFWFNPDYYVYGHELDGD